jgi:hypothetical protein
MADQAYERGLEIREETLGPQQGRDIVEPAVLDEPGVG